MDTSASMRRRTKSARRGLRISFDFDVLCYATLLSTEEAALRCAIAVDPSEKFNSNPSGANEGSEKAMLNNKSHRIMSPFTMQSAVC
jgi:hypothetical protein